MRHYQRLNLEAIIGKGRYLKKICKNKTYEKARIYWRSCQKTKLPKSEVAEVVNTGIEVVTKNISKEWY